MKNLLSSCGLNQTRTSALKPPGMATPGGSRDPINSTA